jgi:hypothetical protein
MERLEQILLFPDRDGLMLELIFPPNSAQRQEQQPTTIYVKKAWLLPSMPPNSSKLQNYNTGIMKN